MPRPIIIKILGIRIPQASGVIDQGAAHLDDPNVFTEVNTFPGLRVGTVVITEDYELRTIDFEVLADASAGNIIVSLPEALGTGQIYRVKKTDATTNTVLIAAQGSDLIDGSATITLENQYDDFTTVDGAISVWDKFTGGEGTDVAHLSQHNVFTNLNTLTGVQFGTQTVTEDYTLTELDYELLVDGTLDSIDITLPPATGSGQVFRVKKIDDTSSIIAVIADGTDTIDGSISLNLDTQWADCTIIDAAPGYWDNTGGLEPLDPSFTDLVDVPSSYTGEALKVVRVNAAEDGLEFAISAGGAPAWGDITGTLSDQTDLQTELDAKVDENGAITGDTKTKITYDTKGLITAGADATTADIADSSNKRYVTDAQLTVIGNTSGTNTGDQTSIVGITGSLAEFNTALTGADFASGGGTATGTNTGDQTSIVGITGSLAEFNTALTGADFASGGGTVTGASSGTNTGDQTSIVGITGTKAQFDTAVTDGNILYVGDVTQYTDELAQDAVGGMVDTTLTYVDATPLLQRSALTGAVTASAGSNTTALGSFTTAQINTALSDNDIATGGGTATGTNTGDQTTIVGITGTLAEFNTALTGADFASGGGTATGTNTGDQTITLTGEVTGTGTGSFATTIADSVAVSSWVLTSPTITTGIEPTSNDGAALGTTTKQFSDLFLAETGVINWDNGDATITQAGDVLTVGGADLKVTTPGNVATSVITTDGTQTLTNKTLTSPTLTTPSAFTTGGAITLAENTSVALDPAGSADGKYSGLTVTAISGYTQAFGDLVTLDKDDSRWEAVDISVAAAATGDARGIMGMVVSTGTDGNACTILLQGIIRADANFPALTIGAAVYASTTGDIVVAQPTTTDHVIRLVGYALTADEIYFNPDPTWITHT